MEEGGEVVKLETGELALRSISGRTWIGDVSSDDEEFRGGEGGSAMYRVDTSSIVVGIEGSSCEVNDRPRLSRESGRGTLLGRDEEKLEDLRGDLGALKEKVNARAEVCQLTSV